MKSEPEGIATELEGATAGSEAITIATPGVRLAARVWGPSDGPLVLALHGWLDNATSLDGLAERLPGLRIVALDLPGHGLSTHHAPGHLYGFVDLVSEVFWAIQVLGWSKLAIIGHSLGAAIASTLAGTFPDRVVRLVLLDGIGPSTEEPSDAPARLARSLNDQLHRARKRERPVFPDRDAVLRIAKTRRSMRDASIEHLMERNLKPVEGGFTWASDARLRIPSRLRLTEAHVQAFLRRITCPVLVVRASEGIMTDSDVSAARLAAIRNVHVHDVPGRHHVHMDYPERIAPIVAAFLSGLRREGATRPDADTITASAEDRP